MRKIILLLVVLGFLLIGVSDLFQGRYRTGIVSVLLGIVNLLVLI